MQTERCLHVPVISPLRSYRTDIAVGSERQRASGSFLWVTLSHDTRCGSAQSGMHESKSNAAPACSAVHRGRESGSVHCSTSHPHLFGSHSADGGRRWRRRRVKSALQHCSLSPLVKNNNFPFINSFLLKVKRAAAHM